LETDAYYSSDSSINPPCHADIVTHTTYNISLTHEYLNLLVSAIFYNAFILSFFFFSFYIYFICHFYKQDVEIPHDAASTTSSFPSLTSPIVLASGTSTDEFPFSMALMMMVIILLYMLNALFLSNAVLHTLLQWSRFATKSFSNISFAFLSCFQLALQLIYPCSFHLLKLPVYRLILAAFHSPFIWIPFLPSSFQPLLFFLLFLLIHGPGVGVPKRGWSYASFPSELGSGGVWGGDWRMVLGKVLLLANHLIASTVQLLLTATVKSRPSMIVISLCVRPVKQLP
jgi:hypothetical protein